MLIPADLGLFLRLSFFQIPGLILLCWCLFGLRSFVMKLGLLEVDIPGLVENCIGFVRSAEASNMVGVNII